jgi:proline iminopeptidase
MAQQPQAKGYEHDDAWDVNWLRVDETHEVYYEQYGLKDGKSGMCASSTPPIILVDI